MTSSAALGLPSSRPPSDELTLDQLLAASIVQQLMRRDGIDEATIRHLLRETARRALRAEDDLDADEPDSIDRLLHETARLWCSRYNREVRPRLPGYTRARCTVLIYLAQHEGVNQASLAKTLEIRPITLVRLLDRLEADGFVTRMPTLDDRRAHVLTLTAKALPILEYICDLTRRIYDDLLLGLSQAEDSRQQSPMRACVTAQTTDSAYFNDQRLLSQDDLFAGIGCGSSSRRSRVSGQPDGEQIRDFLSEVFGLLPRRFR
jgi:MarR family transcriptional regulator, transcriptional regulator for hemolysin